MKIAVLGAGNMGRGLGRIWAGKGHAVIFSFSRNMDRLRELAASMPNAEAASPAEAVAQSDIVLFSVRWTNAEEAIRAAGSLEGKVLIDCTNPLKPDLSGLAVGHTTSAAEEIAAMAPGVRVVKAFNTVFAETYHSRSRLFGSRLLSMFFCGDNADAKGAVEKLIRDAGFNPLDVGPLKIARYLEPLAMFMIHLGYVQGMGTNIALSLIRR